MEPGYQTFPLIAGARDIDLTVERSQVRLFGVSFEKNTPGVIYNSLGLIARVQVQTVVRYFDKPQWTEELQHQHPDLVVINYGTNEDVIADYIERYYPGELRQVIEAVKAAVPRASVLVVSPMDRGQRDSDSRIATVPTLPRLVDIQRRWRRDGLRVLQYISSHGRRGTMARWYDSQPRLVSADFTRPLPAGARKVGVLLDQALESGYRQFKAREQRRPHSGQARSDSRYVLRSGACSGGCRPPKKDQQEKPHKKRVRVPVVYVCPPSGGRPCGPSVNEAPDPLAFSKAAEPGAILRTALASARKYVAAHFAVRRFAHRVGRLGQPDASGFQAKFSAGGPGYTLAGPPVSRVPPNSTAGKQLARMVHQRHRGPQKRRDRGPGWSESHVAVGGRDGDPECRVPAAWNCITCGSPGGGQLEFSVDGAPTETIDTDGQDGPGVYSYAASPGPHQYMLRTLSSAPVRLFGWVAQNHAGGTYKRSASTARRPS